MASTRKSSRKKRRESWSEDEEVDRSPQVGRMPTRRAGNRKTVEFSSDEEDFQEDSQGEVLILNNDKYKLNNDRNEIFAKNWRSYVIWHSA